VAVPLIRQHLAEPVAHRPQQPSLVQREQLTPAPIVEEVPLEEQADQAVQQVCAGAASPPGERRAQRRVVLLPELAGPVEALQRRAQLGARRLHV
jgi:hypothetical protein